MKGQRALVVLVSVLVLMLAGCTQQSPSAGDSSSKSAPAPSASPSPAAPANDWTVSDARVNPMDGVKTQFVTAGYGVRLVLCFENGKPCGHGSVPIDLRAPCWIDGNEPGGYRRRVRIKFDEEKPRIENWGITDDHKSLVPPRPQAFLAELKSHKTFMAEFGCDRSDPGEVMTIPIRGLQLALDQMQSEYKK